MPQLSRRRFLQAAGATTAVLALPGIVLADDAKKAGATLPKLPYDYDALEPHIDAETMKIHHDFHHKAYVDNVNKALAGNDDLLAMSTEDLLRDTSKIPEKIRQAVINNGGGHVNHTMFWNIMGAKGGGTPSGTLGAAIDEAFGSFDKFQTLLATAAATRFGSGWGWLILDGGKLKVISTANQDSPISKGQSPIMGIDVWEHAYYLRYRNKRPDYVKAWWNTVNWAAVTDRYEAAKKQA